MNLSVGLSLARTGCPITIPCDYRCQKSPLNPAEGFAEAKMAPHDAEEAPPVLTLQVLPGLDSHC